MTPGWYKRYTAQERSERRTMPAQRSRIHRISRAVRRGPARCQTWRCGHPVAIRRAYVRLLGEIVGRSHATQGK